MFIVLFILVFMALSLGVWWGTAEAEKRLTEQQEKLEIERRNS